MPRDVNSTVYLSVRLAIRESTLAIVRRQYSRAQSQAQRRQAPFAHLTHAP